MTCTPFSEHNGSAHSASPSSHPCSGPAPRLLRFTTTRSDATAFSCGARRATEDQRRGELSAADVRVGGGAGRGQPVGVVADDVIAGVKVDLQQRPTEVGTLAQLVADGTSRSPVGSSARPRSSTPHCYHPCSSASPPSPQPCPPITRSSTSWGDLPIGWTCVSEPWAAARSSSLDAAAAQATPAHNEMAHARFLCPAVHLWSLGSL
jgi:hypothetical protein